MGDAAVIPFFRARWLGQRFENGDERLWGHGVHCDGSAFTFWLRDGSWTFKPASTYSKHRSAKRDHDNSIAALVGEKVGKGYERLRLTPSRQRMVQKQFLFSHVSGAVHMGHAAS